jgi:hypothetical protein
MNTTADEPMTEILLELVPEALERLEAMAAQQACTVDELVQGMLDRWLKEQKCEAEPPAGGCPLPVS